MGFSINFDMEPQVVSIKLLRVFTPQTIEIHEMALEQCRRAFESGGNYTIREFKEDDVWFIEYQILEGVSEDE